MYKKPLLALSLAAALAVAYVEKDPAADETACNNCRNGSQKQLQESPPEPEQVAGYQWKCWPKKCQRYLVPDVRDLIG